MVVRDSKWLQLILKYKWLIILFYLLLTITSLHIISQAVLSTSLSSFIQKDSDEYRDYASLNEEFASEILQRILTSFVRDYFTS